MLRALCTTPALRSRFALIDALTALLPTSRNTPRQMAVPLDRPSGFRLPLTLAAIGLAFTVSTATAARYHDLATIAQASLAGLGVQEVFTFDRVDLADVPAMDARLAQIVDPRPKFALLFGARQQRLPVQPFEYVVKDGETLPDIAARFGTAVSALLWNNGLESPDQLQSGARLTILPVTGVLHLVQAEETLTTIAERYGARVDDLVVANALDRPDRIEPGQVIVVAGVTVPMPTLTVAQAPGDSADATDQGQTVALSGREEGPAPVRAGREVYVDRPAPVAEPAGDWPEPPGALESADALPRPSNTSAWQREFILSIAPGARESQRKTGVPASVTLAQAILESDWGRSKLTREAKNLFGIKAMRSPGTAGVYNIETWEVLGGANVTVMAAFKAYTSLADSIVDHGRWFHENSRYRRALQVRDDPREFARAINDAGYATDPAYSAKLITLMEKHNLFSYDLK